MIQDLIKIEAQPGNQIKSEPKLKPKEVHVSGVLMTSRTINERNKALVKLQREMEYVKVTKPPAENFYYDVHDYQEIGEIRKKRKIKCSRLKTIDEIVIVIPEEKKYQRHQKKKSVVIGCCTS